MPMEHLPLEHPGLATCGSVHGVHDGGAQPYDGSFTCTHVFMQLFVPCAQPPSASPDASIIIDCSSPAPSRTDVPSVDPSPVSSRSSPASSPKTDAHPPSRKASNE